MTLNKQRIREIAVESFANASNPEIQTWLRGAILGWSTKHSVLSFSPFHNFFPSTQDEIESLSQILQALPTEKAVGLTYSIRGQFRKALINLIGVKGIFLSNQKAHDFLFDLVKELKWWLGENDAWYEMLSKRQKRLDKEFEEAIFDDLDSLYEN